MTDPLPIALMETCLSYPLLDFIAVHVEATACHGGAEQ
jgi:hypothetical protein